MTIKTSASIETATTAYINDYDYHYVKTLVQGYHFSLVSISKAIAIKAKYGHIAYIVLEDAMAFANITFPIQNPSSICQISSASGGASPSTDPPTGFSAVPPQGAPHLTPGELDASRFAPIISRHQKFLDSPLTWSTNRGTLKERVLLY